MFLFSLNWSPILTAICTWKFFVPPLLLLLFILDTQDGESISPHHSTSIVSHTRDMYNRAYYIQSWNHESLQGAGSRSNTARIVCSLYKLLYQAQWEMSILILNCSSIVTAIRMEVLCFSAFVTAVYLGRSRRHMSAANMTIGIVYYYRCIVNCMCIHS